MSKLQSTVRFFNDDFPRTLFPLELSRQLITDFHDEIASHILSRTKQGDMFLPQSRAYASKKGHQLRRTLKLDPVAELFLYRVVHRARRSFTLPSSSNRRTFGYRFNSTRMIPPAKSYRKFQIELEAALDQYTHCVRTDISQYFNSLYQHDLSSWFEQVALNRKDAKRFSSFLREISAGRSIDCLPHGLYPAKVIGSNYLSFLDESSRLRARLMLRFMDDIYLFDDDLDLLLHDLYQVQRLIGEKGLSLNTEKTIVGQVTELKLRRDVDDIKLSLLNRRAFVMFGSDTDLTEVMALQASELEDASLTNEEVEYLLELLENEDLPEEDAELVLALMRDHSHDVLEYIPQILHLYPSLSKPFYHFAAHIPDRVSLLELIRSFVSNRPFVPEYQLFWLGKLCQDRLMNVDGVGELLFEILHHPSATDISKAKVLEISDDRFGLDDERIQRVRSGASGWIPWSSAIGMKHLPKQQRNHELRYFKKASPLNELIATCVQRI